MKPLKRKVKMHQGLYLSLSFFFFNFSPPLKVHDWVNQNNLYDVTLCRFLGGGGRDKIQLIFGQTISFGTALKKKKVSTWHLVSKVNIKYSLCLVLGQKKFIQLELPSPWGALPIPILSVSCGKNQESEQVYWSLICHLKGRPYCCLLRCVGDSTLRPSYSKEVNLFSGQDKSD